MDPLKDLVIKVVDGEIVWTDPRRVKLLRYQRAEINNLFGINLDVNYSLTYADEDGDQVTLASNKDFRDAVFGQRLNPLRINVQSISNPSRNCSKIPSPQSVHAHNVTHRGIACRGCREHPIIGPWFKSNVKEDYDLCWTCYSKMGNDATFTRIDVDLSSLVYHYRVQCDGCKITPIVGPRFKSNVRENYNLCIACFSKMGNIAQYTRIDQAMVTPQRSPSIGLSNVAKVMSIVGVLFGVPFLD
ncbi:uncharacterized protein LOC144709784 isoform X2 [Wolffia australiana]